MRFGEIVSNTATVHVICHKESGTKYKGLDDIDRAAFIFDSRAWGIKREEAAKLIGGLFCIHSAKRELSEFGGEILAITYSPQANNNGEEMAVVRFKAVKGARGIAWPATTNPNEFLRVSLRP